MPTSKKLKYRIKWDWGGHYITTARAGEVGMWFWFGRIKWRDGRSAYGLACGPVYVVVGYV